MIANALETLLQLIRIPSVNPLGREPLEPPFGEAGVTDYLEHFFRNLKVPYQRVTVSPGRDNILARIEPDYVDPARPIVLFDAHQDTVPVDGMTIDPWNPVRDGDRIYGRGACDVKGAMACMLTAFARLAHERPREMPALVMACTVNEENGFTGAQSLAQLWTTGNSTTGNSTTGNSTTGNSTTGNSTIIPQPPAQIIVAEPTELHVVVTHKGVVRWRCHAQGTAAHSATPHRGENAIYRMGHALVALQQYAALLASRAGDPRLGSPTMNVGTIRGGLCVNAVPDRCTIELDRRLLPDEDPTAARDELLNWLAQHVPDADRFQHEAPFLMSRGLNGTVNGELAQRLQQVVHQHGQEAQCVGVPYGTNAPFLAGAATSTVVFGPGSIAQAHTVDEWISVEQMRVATEVYYAIGRGQTLMRIP
jgi:acetylornithine deacetylase